MKRFSLKLALVAVTLSFFTPLAAQTFSIVQNPAGDICPNTSVTISVADADMTRYRYEWSWTDENMVEQQRTDASFTISPKTKLILNLMVYDKTAPGYVGDEYHTINVLAAPVVTVEQPIVYVRSGNNATLRASAPGATSFQWYDTDGNAIAGQTSDQLVLTNVTVPTRYWVDARNGDCTSASRAFVDVRTISFTSSAIAPVCVGSDVTLTAHVDGGVSYIWSSGGTSGGSTTVRPTDVPKHTYTVTIKDAADKLIAVESIEVPVLAKPIVQNITADNSMPCRGARVKLTAVAQDPANVASYLWDDHSTDPIRYIYPDVDRSYWVQITDVNGCVSDKYYITIPVHNPGTAQLNLPATMCAGETRVLTVSGGTAERWYNDFETLSTNANCSFSPQRTGTVKIYCNVNVDGCIVKLEGEIEVLDELSPTIIANPSYDICEGEAVTLSASTPATTGTTFLWSNNQTTHDITVSPVVGTHTYTLEVTRGGCKSSPVSATVNVFKKPVVTIPTPAPVCRGAIAEITANVSGGSGDYSFSWDDANNTQSAKLNLTSAQTQATRTYQVVVTDNRTKCTGTASVTVAISEEVSPTIVGPTEACSGVPFTLYISENCDSYEWNDELSTTTKSMSATLTSTRTFTAIVVKNGCRFVLTHTVNVPTDSPTGEISGTPSFCEGETTTLTAPEGNQTNGYLWNTGETTKTIEVGIAGTYWVDVTRGTCTVRKSIVVNKNTPVLPTILADKENICAGESVRLEASNFVEILSWQKGAVVLDHKQNGFQDSPTATTTYTLIVKDVNGCQASVSKTIVVNPVPNLLINGDKTKVCVGSPISVSVSNAPAGSTYSWSKAGTLSNNNATLTFIASEGDIDVSVEVTTPSACRITKTFAFEVTSVPSGEITGLTTVCKGNSVTLYAPAGANKYLWDDGTTTAQRTTPILNNVGVETFSVELTYDGGCTQTLSKSITVEGRPEGTLDPSKEVVCLGDDVTLTANVPGATTYRWMGGSTTTSNLFYDTPTAEGTKTYTVVAYTNNCSIEISRTITVVAYTPGSIDEVNSTKKVCAAGEAATIVAKGGERYKLGSNENTTGIFIVNPSVTTDYTIYIYNSNNCESVQTHRIEVQGLEEPTISGQTKICKGGTANLSTAQADSYLWQRGTTVLSNKQTLNVVNVQSTENYSLTITKGSCSATTVFTIEAVELPTDANIVGPDKVCENSGPIVLTAQGTGTYRWDDGSTSATRTVVPTAANHVYELTLINETGCEQTIQKNISIKARPSVSILGVESGKVCKGESITLTAVGSPSGGTYSWNDGTNAPVLTTIPTVSRDYTVTYTDADGCTATETRHVDVVELQKPIIQSDNGTDICLNGAGTRLWVTPQAGYTYFWPDLGRSGASVEVNPIATTTYTLEVTNPNGCKIESQITINVHEVPTPYVIVSPSSTICQGEVVTITVTGGTKYKCGTSATNTSGVFTLSPTSTMVYNIEVSNAAGCTATTTQTITVRPRPSVQILGANSACLGSDVTLTATGAVSYLWSNGQTGENCTLTMNNPVSETISVTGTDADGCESVLVTKVITTNQKPNITIDGDLDICQGETTTLTANGVVGDNYLWEWSGGSYIGKTLANISPSSDITYTVTATDGNGCQGTASTTVKVNPIPTPGIMGPSEVCQGGKITLTATGGGSYRWGNGSTAATLEVTEPGEYEVVVTGVGGCSATAKHVVTLKTIVAQISGVTQSCSGEEIYLTASGGTVEWDADPDITGTERTNSTVSVAPTATRTYWATITQGGCSVRKSHTVTINPAQRISITGATSVCVGKPVTLTATLAGATNFYWEGGPASAIYTITLNDVESRDYTVHATDMYGCPVEETITVTSTALPVAQFVDPRTTHCLGSEGFYLEAQGGQTYRWRDRSETGSRIFVNPTVTTTYRVVAINANGCESAEVAHTVTVNPKPTATIDGPTQACKNEQITLTASAANSYLWSTGETTQSITPTITADINFTVTVSDVNGCTNTAEKTIHMIDAHQLYITGNLEVCAGTGGTDLTASAIPGATYSWNTGQAGQTLHVETAGEYTVTARYGNCEQTAKANVIIYPQPTIEIVSTEGDAICPGTTTKLTASEGTSYFWQPGGETSREIFVTPTVNTTYSVRVVDNHGCIGTAQKTISLKTIPSASVSGPATSCAGEPIQLTASGGSVRWLDDNSTANPRTVSPTATTTYRAEIEGANGCKVIKEWKVIVNAKPNLTYVGQTNICYGQSTQLVASGADDGTYVWTWAGGTATGNSITVDPSTTTQYTVRATKGSCPAELAITVTVNQLPTPIITPSDSRVCEGDQVVLTASGGSSYVWSNGDTGPSITVTPTAPSTTYWVKATDGNGCTSAEKEVTIDVDRAVNVTIQPSATRICRGEKVTLTANGATTYLWSTGETTQSIEVYPTNDGDSYTVTGTSGECTNSQTQIIRVNEIPQVLITGSLEICRGETTTLVASADDAATYNWANGLGNNNSITVSPVVDTQYSVEVMTNSGCKGTKTVTVKVYERPNPVIDGNREICRENGSTTLTVNGSDLTQCVWNTGSQSFSINVTEAGTYTATVTGKGKCTTTVTAIVTYKEAVNGSISGADQPICQGEDVTLVASGGTSYKWDNNSSEGAELHLYNVQVGGTYWVTITGANGCTQRLSKNVVVRQKPDLRINGKLTFCEGGSTKLTAVGNGTVLWNTGATSKEIIVSVEDDYTVELTDAAGCKTSETVHVTRNALPVAIISGPTSICEGEAAVTLTASGADSYVWSTGERTASITVSPTKTTIYTVTPQTGDCTGDPTSHTLTVNPKPNLQFNGDQIVCEGESAYISVSGADEYTWDNGQVGSSITTAPLNGTTTFTVTGRNTTTNCEAKASYTVNVIKKPQIRISGKQAVCAGQSTTLLADPIGAESYLWSNGSTNRQASFNNLLSNYSYWVEVTVGGCTARYDGLIKVNPLPVVDITTNTGETQVCRGDKIELTASGGNTYLWHHDRSRNPKVEIWPENSRTYTVTVEGEGGCEVTRSIDIQVVDKPNLAIKPNKDVVCEGDAVTLSATDGMRWQWYLGNNPISGATDQHYTISSAPRGITTYSVEAFNAAGCSEKVDFQLSVLARPVFEILGNTNICYGDQTTLTGPALIDANTGSYLWSTGETTRSITVSPMSSTDYTLTVKNGDCEYVKTVQVTVHPKPTPSLQALPAEICAGKSATLTAGAGYTFYKWSTGQQGASNSIIVSPQETTIYTVEVTDGTGCVGTQQVEVRVTNTPPPTITIVAGSDEVCAGDQVVLKSSPAKTYEWSNNVGLAQINNQTVVISPTQTSNYTLKVEDMAGCVSTATIVIRVKEAATPRIIGKNNICAGESVTLRATSDLPGTTFEWSNGSHDAEITVKPPKTTTYTVYAFNGACKNPVGTDFQVTVNSLPNAQITGDSEICAGKTATLVASGGSLYFWHGIEGGSNNTVVVRPTQTTTYICTVTDDKGCSKDARFEVVVNKLPTPSVTGNRPICAGESITLKASGGTQYVWHGDGIVNPNNPEQLLSPAYTTTYTVDIYNAKGCMQTQAVDVVVTQLPNARIDGPATICRGETADLTVKPNDGRNYTYKWKHDNSTANTTSVRPIANTTYEVDVFDGTCVRTLTHTITVNNIATPIISGPTQICLGETAELFVSNVPNYYVSYDWVETHEETQSIRVTPNKVGQHQYTVRVTDNNECIAENVLYINVVALPEAKVRQEPETLCSGTGVVTLFGEGAGQGGTYSFYADEYATVLLSGGDEVSQYQFTNLDVTTDVYVVAINKNKCRSLPTKHTIEVVQKPQPFIRTDKPTTKICEGGTLQLTVEDLGGDPNVTYEWNDGTVGAYLLVTAAGDYTVTATNERGCSQNATIKVEEELLPAAQIVPSIMAGEGGIGEGAYICSGSRVTLTAEPSSIPGGTSYTYKWNNGDVSQSIIVNPTATTQYSVTVTSSSGCENTAELVLHVNEFAKIKGPADNKVCAGKPYTLTAEGNNLAYYEWYRNGVHLPEHNGNPVITVTDDVPIGQPSAEISYSMKATYDNHCESETDITITVYAKPDDLSINGITDSRDELGNLIEARDSVCIDMPMLLAIHPLRGSSLENATYSWTGFGIEPADAANATQTISIDHAGTEIYSCQVTMQGGCDTVVSLRIKTIPLPEMTVCADTTICEGDVAKLYLKAINNNPAGTIVTWTSTNGGGGQTNSLTDTVFVTPTDTTVYTVTAKTETPRACSSTQTVTVNVVPRQTPVITANPAIVCLDASGVGEVDLTLSGPENDSQARPFQSFKWYAEDDPTTVLGTTYSIIIDKANITATRTYVLEVTTQEGCLGINRLEVAVSPKPSISITGSGEVCAGKNYQLFAENPVNVVRYEWTTNLHPDVVFATTADVIVTPTADEDTYYLTVYNQNDCSYQTTGHQVKINPCPQPRITASDNPVCADSQVTLTATDDAGLSPSFTWSTGSTGSQLIIPAGTLKNTTIYTVTAIDSKGCEASYEYELVVNPRPVLAITGNTSVCVGDKVMLEVRDSRGAAATAASTYSWTGGSWTPDPSVTNNSKIWVEPTDIANVTTYSVTAVDGNGCTTAAPVDHNIQAYSKPIVRINDAQLATTTVCVGEALTMTATGGTKFQWGPASKTTSTSQIFTTPVFTAPTSSISILENERYHIYWVDVTNENGCTERDSIRIQVAAKPQVSIGVQPVTALNVMCAEDEVTLTANANNVANVHAGTLGFEYSWSTNTDEPIENPNQMVITHRPTKNTIYTVVVTDIETGCKHQVSQTINVNPLPDVRFKPAPNTICEDENVVLELEGELAGMQIDWSKTKNGVANGFKFGGTANYDWVNSLSVTDSLPEFSDYIYTAVITNPETHCSRTISHNVRVNHVARPLIKFDPLEAAVMCQNEIRHLRAENEDGNDWTNTEVRWYADGVFIEGSLNGYYVEFSPNQTTLYTLEVTNVVNGCVRTHDTIIKVLEIPKVEIIEADNQRICQDDTYTLTVEGTGYNTLSWSRTIDGVPDGFTSGNKSIVIDSIKAGTHVYTLQAHATMCNTTLTRTVVVGPMPEIEVEFQGGSSGDMCEGEQYADEELLMQAKRKTPGGTLSTTEYDYFWLQGTDTLSKLQTQLRVSKNLLRESTTYTFVLQNKTTQCERRVDVPINIRKRPKVTLNHTDDVEKYCVGDVYDLVLTGPSFDDVIEWQKFDDTSNALLETRTEGLVHQDHLINRGNFRYQVKVLNALGCDTTIVRRISVGAAPVPVVTINSGVTPMCEGQAIRLEATLTGVGSVNFNDIKVRWMARNGEESVDTLEVNELVPTFYPSKTTTYQVEVEDLASGCKSTQDFTVVVERRPAMKFSITLPNEVVSLPSDITENTICEGETVKMELLDTVLWNNDGLTVRWERNGTEVAEWSDRFFVMHTPTIDETYKITVGNGTCSTVFAYTLKVNRVPYPMAQIRIGPMDSIICEGELVELGGAEDQNTIEYDYLWTSSNPAEVINEPMLRDIQVRPATSTTYTYTITSKANGCSRSHSILIKVNKSPKVALEVNYPDGTLDENKICQTSKVRLLLRGGTTAADGVESIHWLKNGLPVLEWQDLSEIEDEPTETTRYKVIVKNALCELAIDTLVTVVKVPAPTIVEKNNLTEICEGKNVTLKAFEAQTSNYTYLWTSSNPNEHFDDPTAPAQLVAPIVTTSYTYTVTEPVSGCSRSDSYTVTVHKKPIATLKVSLPASATADSTICAGEAVTLEVVTPTTDNLTIRWEANNKQLPQYDGLWKLVNLTPDSTTDYRAVVVSEFGCEATEMIERVKVLYVPDPKIVISSGSQTSCESAKLILLAAVPQENDKHFVYRWQSSNVTEVFEPNNTGQSITVYPKDITTYSYTITDTITGCTRTSQMLINVNKKPKVTLLNHLNQPARDTTICGGHPVILQVSGENLDQYEYRWYKDDELQPETGSRYTDVPEKAANKYNVIIRNRETGCETALEDYVVNIGVYVIPQPIIEIANGQDAVICKGESLTLNVKGFTPDATNYTYKWQEGTKNYGSKQSITVSPDQTTTYTYTIGTKNKSCERTAAIQIVVNDPPVVQLQSSLNPIDTYCAGDPITLSVVPVEGTNTDAKDLSVTWLRNNEVIAGQTGLTLVDRPLGNANNLTDTVYTYEAVVQNSLSHCQADRKNLKFTVNVAPLIQQPQIKVFDNDGNTVDLNKQLCPDRQIRLQGPHASGAIFEYIWTAQNRMDDIMQTDKPNEVWVSPSTTTTYTLEVRNVNTGCSRINTVTLNVLPVPKIKIETTAKTADGMSVACVNDPDFVLTVLAEDGSHLDDSQYLFEWYEKGTVNELSDIEELEVSASAVCDKVYVAKITPTLSMPELECPVTVEHRVRVMEAPTTITIDAYTGSLGDQLLPEEVWVCSGEPVTLEARFQPNMTYEWRDEWGTQYVENNTQKFTVNPQKTTTYTVRVTNMAGCSHEISRQIKVNPRPTASISGPTSFCLESVGETFRLKAASSGVPRNTVFVWTYTTNGGTQTFEGTTLEYAPQATGTYEFTLIAYENKNGIVCQSDPSLHKVIVAGVPKTTISDLRVTSSQNGEACVNRPIVIEATEGYTKYVFGVTNGTIYEPKQESDHNLWSITQNTEGTWTYYCDFYNEAGCRSRVEIPVKVNRQPDGITISAPADKGYNYVDNKEITICEGTELPLTANATGDKNTYSWRDTEGNDHGSTKEVLVQPHKTTEYQLTVTNPSGCEVSGRFTVKVIPMDKLVLTADNVEGTKRICAGDTRQITLRVTGSREATYDWISSLNNKRLSQPSSIIIDAPTQTETWWVYAVSSSNSPSTNCKSVASIEIEVVQRPDNRTGDIKVTSGNQSTTVCAGSTVTMAGDAQFAETFRWSTGEVKPEISVPIPNFAEETTLRFWAIGRNSLGCESTTDTMWITLTVKPQPEPEFLSKTVYYVGQPFRLEAKDKTLAYRWYDIEGNELSRKYFCDLQHDETGIYTYRLTAINDAGCETTKSVAITIVEFRATPSGLTFLCSGTSSDMWVEGCSLAEGYQFRWMLGGQLISSQDTVTVQTLGTYSVEVVTPWNTSDIASFEIRQSETPSVKFGTPTPACQGDRNVILPYSTVGGTPTSYTLTFDESVYILGFQDVIDATTTMGYVMVGLPPSVPAGVYVAHIVLKNAQGCESNEYRIPFTVGYDLIDEVWDDVIICNNTTNEFVAFQWYRNNERITGATLQYYSELGGFRGEYYVVAYKANGQQVTSCARAYDNKQNIALSPNPLKRNQNLRVEVPFAADVLFGSQIEIVDALGRVVQRIDHVENVNEVLVTYPDGVYMVRLMVQSGEVFTEKFVVK